MLHNDEEAKWQEATQDAKQTIMRHPLLSKSQSGVKKRPTQFAPANR